MSEPPSRPGEPRDPPRFRQIVGLTAIVVVAPVFGVGIDVNVS